jgi:hypothetical protein
LGAAHRGCGFAKYHRENYQLVQRVLRGKVGSWDDYFYIYRKVRDKPKRKGYDFFDLLETALISDSDQPAENPWHAWVARDSFTIAGRRLPGIYSAAASSIAYHVEIPARSTKHRFFELQHRDL